jgi:electron transfer flavoprotein beta subunit
MPIACQLIVCAGIVPDPLQTLEPVTGTNGPALKNELLLPHVIDPWAAHALYEAANLSRRQGGSQVYLVSLAPKAKLQQVMMTVAQRVPLTLVAVDAPSSGFVDSVDVAEALAGAIQSIPGFDLSRALVFGGWESASRGAGSTLQMTGERLGIIDQFQGVDEVTIQADGSLRILERVEGGQHQVSVCAGPPALLGWATGNLPEPANSPQVGMMNMRGILPALQKAKPAAVAPGGCFKSVALPKQQRDTRVVRDLPADEIAREILEWVSAE